MIYKQKYLLFMAIFACWLHSEGTKPITNDIIPIHMMEAGIVDPENDPELTKMMMLDNKLMRDMYLVSTDKVFSMNEIQSMIYAVASRPNINLDDAVTTIVNLKLIRRLHFVVLHSFVAGCESLDSPSGQSPDDEAVINSSANIDEATVEELAEESSTTPSITEEPRCLSRDSTAVKESSKLLQQRLILFTSSSFCVLFKHSMLSFFYLTVL